MQPTIYDAMGGRNATLALAYAWHERCLADPIVSHAFSHGYHPQHTERLATYWAEALGGPREYTQSVGDESAVVRLHSGHGEHHEMDERAQVCFARALDDAGIPADPDLRATLVVGRSGVKRATRARIRYSPTPALASTRGSRIARWRMTRRAPQRRLIAPLLRLVTPEQFIQLTEGLAEAAGNA
jgi:truncated hemoglobin YjbI